MAAHLVLALGIVLVVLLILVARARTRPVLDERDETWAFISRQIDEHIEGLAAG